MSVNDINGKIIIIGDSTVGKTTLSMCLLKLNNKNVESTKVAAAFFKYTRTLDGNTINMDVWDTAGQEQYQSMARLFYRNAHCVIIIFDVTSTVSFENVNEWHKIVKDQLGENVSIIMVANKVDNIEDRVVTREQAASKARQLRSILVETSGLLGTNVDKLFDLAAKLIMKKLTIDLNDSTPTRHSRFISPLRKKSNPTEPFILTDSPREIETKNTRMKCF